MAGMLKDLLAGIHCRLFFNWENPSLSELEFDFETNGAYPLMRDSMLGLVLFRDGWPIKIRRHLSQPRSEELIRDFAHTMRDTVCINTVARIAAHEPLLLPYIPRLPRSLTALSTDPHTVTHECVQMDEVWRSVVFRLHRQSGLPERFGPHRKRPSTKGNGS